MVGRAGASQDAPVPMVAGYANPVRLTTHKIGVFGGGLSKPTIEAANMATIPTLAQPEITVINGKAVTTSLAIAEHFSKQHKNVIQKIQSLECSSEFNGLNFKPVEYTDAKGERRPCYQITRDGFAFLAMGFTGKRAAQFKEAYITAFNAMESALQQPIPLPLNNLQSTSHNAAVAAEYLSIIFSAWSTNIQPMLIAANSPLAWSLRDRINDAATLTAQVANRLKRLEGAK